MYLEQKNVRERPREERERRHGAGEQEVNTEALTTAGPGNKDRDVCSFQHGNAFLC